MIHHHFFKAYIEKQRDPREKYFGQMTKCECGMVKFLPGDRRRKPIEVEEERRKE